MNPDTDWPPQTQGHYEGTVRVEWLEDGRRMKLLADFAYLDSNQVKWPAPTESVIDGASIPRVAWSIIGGPFEGKYRNASVLHDVACDQKTQPWELVHLMFYEAMLTSGTSAVLAKTMYAAVYHFGPRWPTVVSEDVSGGVGSQVMGAGDVAGVGAGAPDWQGPESMPVWTTRSVPPPAMTLAESQFEALKVQIEQREVAGAAGMSLTEIRAYGGAS